MVDLDYKFDKKSYQECLKSDWIAEVQFKIFFCPQTYILAIIIIWISTPITLPHACGLKIFGRKIKCKYSKKNGIT